MTAQLRKIDERGEILLNDLKHGRITQEQFAAKTRKLRDRCEVLFARQAAKASR